MSLEMSHYSLISIAIPAAVDTAKASWFCFIAFDSTQPVYDQ
jgi:hypothetical protein